jgi:AraC-like DNA-binding protein/mannose-6-phosphate isomerase-like protein (cupin superfamily)
MKELRKKYWNPRNWDENFLNEREFLFPFNMTLDKGDWTSWHEHPSWAEFVVLLSGSAVIETTKLNFLANESKCIWIPPRTSHTFYTLEDVTNRTIFVHESLFQGNERFYSSQMLSSTPLLKELIKVIDDWRLDLRTDEGKRMGLVVWDVIQKATPAMAGLTLPRNAKLQKLANAFLENIEEPISIDEWSKEFGMSAKTLSRVFFRETGMTISQWEQRAKMDHGYRLLRSGESVTDTALACGYLSVSSFITTFKKQFGITPGSLLESAKKTN